MPLRRLRNYACLRRRARPATPRRSRIPDVGSGTDDEATQPSVPDVLIVSLNVKDTVPSALSDRPLEATADDV